MLRMAVEKKTGTSQIAPSAAPVSMRMSRIRLNARLEIADFDVGVAPERDLEQAGF